MDIADLKNISLKFIEQRIEELRTLDCRNSDINHLRTLFKNLFRVYVTAPISISPGTSIYRVRKHWSTVKNSYLPSLANIYPDAKYITCLGRANRIANPAYYFSSDEATALWECRPEVGDVFTVLECTIMDDANALLTPLGIHEMARRHGIAIGGEIPNAYLELEAALASDSECMHKHDLIDQFIKAEFLKAVPAGEEHLYKVTIAIAESAFTYASAEASVDGIAYPSVASIPGSANIALLPLSFARICQPVMCKRVVISNTTLPNKGLGYAEETPANAISSSGKIEWQLPHSR